MTFLKIGNTAPKLFSSGGGLAKKTAQGTFWLFSFRVVDHALRLARTVVLARLLAPNDFGLFGITMMAVSLLETFSQNGFVQALTQKKGDIIPYLDSAWVVQIVRGLVLSLALFFLAPLIAVFFNASQAEPILKVVALAVALQGFYNIAIVYFSKELQFGKYFLYQIVGTLADFVVSVALAFILRSVWALVFGLLAGVVVRLALSYLVYAYVPRFLLNIQKARELFIFGKWVFFTNIIAFFITQADGFFVAKMLGISALGFYQIAYKIPSILAIDILAGAIFPAYTKIQDDLDKMKQAYFKILRLFAIFLLPATGGLVAITPEFIKIFLGEKWLSAAPAMQTLMVATMVWTIAVLSNYVFLALARPEIESKGSAIRFMVLAALLYPMILWWGILGASMAVLVSSLFAAAWFVFMITKLIHCSWKDLLHGVLAPLVNTLCMMALVFLVKVILLVTMGNFLLLVGLGIFVYLGLTYLADKLFGQKMIPLVQETIRLLMP